MKDEEEAIEFLKTLAERIDMKIIKGPFAHYVDTPGNEGLTAIVMIETSHIAFHIWDQQKPAMLQFDLYTCGSLKLDDVISIFKEYFKLKSVSYILMDREFGFETEQSGNLTF
jgi:S-adenosylmethionine/arginine decarboxylase-like enzyme